MCYVFFMTTIVIESTGWWLNRTPLEPDCLALYPGAVLNQLCNLGRYLKKNLSGPQFPHLEHRESGTSCLMGLLGNQMK